MANEKMRVEGMIFNYGTTYRTDYRHGKIRAPVITTLKEKPIPQRAKYTPLRDVHTLAGNAGPISFSLFHKPKDIVGTNPMKVQEPWAKPIDTGLAEAQKTRPRLVMTPAVSMDDIDDPAARVILCDALYTSAAQQASREADAPIVSVKAPLPKLPSPSNPIVLAKLQAPQVSPEWRMDTVEWDRRQLRAHCSQTRHFWLAYEAPRCRACDETAAITANRKMALQTKRN